MCVRSEVRIFPAAPAGASVRGRHRSALTLGNGHTERPRVEVTLNIDGLKHYDR